MPVWWAIRAASAASAAPTPVACRRLMRVPSAGTERARMKIDTIEKRTAESPDGIAAPPRFMSAKGSAK